MFGLKFSIALFQTVRKK